MSIFSKLTIHSLKKNRTRTIVTIIGIILSAAMICAVTTFANSLLIYDKELTIYTTGNWHVRQYNTDYKSCKDLANNSEISDSTITKRIGYASVDSALEYKPYVYVEGTQINATDFFPIHITSGKYPTSSSEILLPDHLYINGGIKHEIGDKITLDLGQRTLDGSALWQDEPCINNSNPTGEELVVRETNTYTVVGFYDHKHYSFEGTYAPGFTAFTIADSTPSDDYVYDVLARMNNPKNAYEFAKEVPCEVNSGLLSIYGVFSLSGVSSTFFALSYFVIGLIIIGSSVLIYNAFSISVSERTKQFGLLSSVGATKKQLRTMILFEAFAVSLIGIPIGVIAGIGGIGITLFAIDKMLLSISTIPVHFSLSISSISVIAAIVIALLTVLISAWIPSIRSTKMNTVDIIRQSTDIKIKNKEIKTPKFIYRLFGIPGVIADKHYKRNKKKYRATVLSLFMSIVLFVSASAFTDYFTSTATEVSDASDYDLYTEIPSYEFKTITPTQLADSMKSADRVTNVILTINTYVELEIDRSYMSEEGIHHLESVCPQKEFTTDDKIYSYSGLSFVDDDTFKALLKQHNLEESDYMDPENPQAIVIDGFTHTNYEEGREEKIYHFNSKPSEVEGYIDKSSLANYYNTGEVLEENGNTYFVFCNYDSGESISLTKDEAYIKETLKIGYITDEIPSYVRNLNGASLLYPMSMYDTMFEGSCIHDDSNEYDNNYIYFSYKINSSNHKESYKALEKILADNKVTDITLTDVSEEEEAKRTLLMVVGIFANGFIILISLIAIANVFNTISTNIALRRREFAILKSIGMTKKEMNKMMCFECLLYGTRALMYGLPVSVILTLFIYRSINYGFDMGFFLPWDAIGIAVLSVFLVVFITMVYAMRKIKKDNPIDALKNENL